MMPSMRTYSGLLGMVLVPTFAYILGFKLCQDGPVYHAFFRAAIAVFFGTAILSIIVAHAIDYHARGRTLTLLAGVVLVTLQMAWSGYSIFELAQYNVFH